MSRNESNNAADVEPSEQRREDPLQSERFESEPQRERRQPILDDDAGAEWEQGWDEITDEG